MSIELDKTKNNLTIKVDHVSKKYCKSLKRSMLYGVKDIARNTFGLSSHSDKLRKNEFWALDDISFEVKKGETLGIIGPNGSGKTTMLKMLNGIFWPDKGKISIKGKVGALIEVGAGFHPLLTGRENIYINAAILGMTKEETDKKFDDIVEFADIGDFLDVPVKHYSSGMFVRLGFAVAVHCEPDILLVDEVLAVGDMQFRAKCYKKMAEMKRKSTIILVSHSSEIINRMCDRVILLMGGKMVSYGDSKEIQGDYFDKITSSYRGKYFKSDNIKKVSIIKSSNNIENGCLKLIKGKKLEFIFEIETLNLNNTSINLNIILFDSSFNLVSSIKSQDIGKKLIVNSNFTRIVVKINEIYLSCGSYYLGIGIFKSNGIELLFNDEALLKIKITTNENNNLFEPGIYSPKFDIFMDN
jgi:lipopolysaccharide transport system ATP-binding protein